MKTKILAFLAGFILAALLAIPVLKFAMRDKYEFGQKNGWLSGSHEVHKFIQKHFLTQRPPETFSDSLIQKSGGIYIVEKDGVKTIEANQY